MVNFGSIKIFPMPVKLFVTMILMGFFGVMNKPEPNIVLEEMQEGTVSSPINFQTDILPIMKSRCNPCHFPGGTMYEKLPFDSAATIAKHAEGILRRIKDETDQKMIRQFAEENKISTAAEK
jgi:hypothetical protein